MYFKCFDYTWPGHSEAGGRQRSGLACSCLHVLPPNAGSGSWFCLVGSSMESFKQVSQARERWPKLRGPTLPPLGGLQRLLPKSVRPITPRNQTFPLHQRFHPWEETLTEYEAMLGTVIRQSQPEPLAPNNVEREMKQDPNDTDTRDRKTKVVRKVSDALREQRKEQSNRETK